MITLTTEQAQQIEEALVEYRDTQMIKAPRKALSIIRAARAQEQAEQEPIGMILGGELVALVEEYQTGAWPIYAAPVQQAEQEPVKREHITDGSPCWCNPELNYKDPETGAEVWVHKEPQ